VLELRERRNRIDLHLARAGLFDGKVVLENLRNVLERQQQELMIY
jgi:hypothetical protein